MLLGISPDEVSAQAAFAEKFGLPMSLLADADHAVAEAYGVWGERNLYGRKFMGVERTTFIIGADGKIARVFRKVKVDHHAAEVLEALREASAA